MRTRDKRYYGCVPDLVDARDRMRLFKAGADDRTPVDLRQYAPSVMDQGALGSCTAHGITCAARYHIIKRMQTDPMHGTYDFDMCRLQLYWWSREVEGSVDYDSGAQIRDVVKVLATHGVGHEENWPYDITKFTETPPRVVEDDAVQYKALDYARVGVSDVAVRNALHAGHPVVIGVSIYDSFETSQVGQDGMIPIPNPSEALLGGHCMCVLGWGQKPNRFTVRNSWGPNWGDSGDCYFPEGYFSKYGADFWTISLFGSDAEKSAGVA